MFIALQMLIACKSNERSHAVARNENGQKELREGLDDEPQFISEILKTASYIMPTKVQFLLIGKKTLR